MHYLFLWRWMSPSWTRVLLLGLVRRICFLQDGSSSRRPFFYSFFLRLSIPQWSAPLAFSPFSLMLCISYEQRPPFLFFYLTILLNLLLKYITLNPHTTCTVIRRYQKTSAKLKWFVAALKQHSQCTVTQSQKIHENKK